MLSGGAAEPLACGGPALWLAGPEVAVCASLTTPSCTTPHEGQDADTAPVDELIESSAFAATTHPQPRSATKTCRPFAATPVTGQVNRAWLDVPLESAAFSSKADAAALPTLVVASAPHQLGRTAKVSRENFRTCENAGGSLFSSTAASSASLLKIFPAASATHGARRGSLDNAHVVRRDPAMSSREGIDAARACSGLAVFIK
jgi:hypothetical protein